MICRWATSAALLAVTLAAGACTGTMPPVTMHVVDETDGTPIVGVIAVFWGDAHEGTITGHGGKTAILFAVEAESDGAGTLQIAKQPFGREPFFLNTNYDGPKMILLKPGYVPRVLFNQGYIIPTPAQAATWEYDGQVLKMKKGTDDEIRQMAFEVTTYLDMVIGFDKLCGWKKVPRALVAADRMYPFPGKTNTLRGLFMNDALFVQQGCGSPTAFFKPYMKP